MKKRLRILFLVQFIFFSCYPKTTKKNELGSSICTKISSYSDQTNISIIKIKIDSTKIKKYAQGILDNRIEPSDNNETFECINQLFAEKEKDLNFYFEVFRVIAKKSDGALSEVIGQYVVKFLKFDPDFFIEKYSKFDTDEKNRFIGFIAYEFYAPETDYKAKMDLFFSGINNEIKSQSDSEMKILTEMKKSVTKETERITNE